MKLCLKILAIVVIAVTTYSVIGCAAPAGFSYQNVSISFTVACSDCPTGVTFNPAYPMPTSANGSPSSTTLPQGAVLTMPNNNGGQGGTDEILASVANAPATNLTWQIYPQPNLGGIKTLPTGTSTPVGETGSAVGTFATPSTTSTTAFGPSVYYSVPSGIPVYSGAALLQAQAMGIPQGDVLIQVSAPADPSNPNAVTTANLLVQLYSPSQPSVFLIPNTPLVPSGLTNPVVSVAHGGGTYQFVGGVVGDQPCLTATACGTLPTYSTDNAGIWEVGPAPFALTTAVPGGNACFGTVSSTGLYTAPAAIPTTSASATCTAAPFTGTAGEVVVVLISHQTTTVNSYAYVGIY